MKSYNKSNIPLAKQLRKNMTPWERKLWYEFLRSYPVRFRRQAAIGDYIVDFYCPQAKLVVELDGAQHYEEAEAQRDNQRTKYLETNGLTVVRIPNSEITTNFEGVCTHIHSIISRDQEVIPMTSSERRIAIQSRLRDAQAPLSATALANDLGVSRQIIVGDVALLRASGMEIQATPRGYVLAAEAAGVSAVLACVHNAADMERELTLMVDYGAEVLDVIVEHPVYGQLTGQLRLRSRYDVAQFLTKAEGAAPLSALTDGIHLHTVRCPDEETLARVTAALREEGFLLESIDS